MKRISRIIAIALAFVLAVCVVPSRTSFASTAKPKLAYATKTLFVNGSKVRKTAKSEFTLKVKNKPSKYSCSWSVSDPDIAYVEALKYGKCKVTAKSVGIADVKCLLTDKKTGNRYELVTKVTVKKNTEDIKLTYKGSLDLKAGDKLKLEGALVDSEGNELISIQPKDVTKAEDNYVSDVIKWTSSNSAVASVNDDGEVTAKTPGTAVINCYSIQNLTGTYSKIKKATAKKTVTVNVKEEIEGVKQTALNKLEVSFGKDMSSFVTKDNLVVTGKTTGINNTVTEVQFSKDGKTAYVTVLNAFPDGAKYVVSYGDMSCEFTSSKGAVVSISVYTNASNVAVVGENTQLNFKAFDSNGVDVTPLDTTSAEYYIMLNKISYALESTGSYTLSGNFIYFMSANTMATVRATYRETPTATPIVAKATITGVSEASLINVDASAIITGAMVGKDIDFTKAAIIAKGDIDHRLVVRAKNAKGEYIYSNAADSKFTFETASPANTIFFIDADGMITPLNEGTAEVKIMYDNTVVGTTSIAIRAERKVTSFKFTTDGNEIAGSIMLSSVPGVDTVDVVITAYDQYGDKVVLSSADQLNVYALGNVSPYIIKRINLDGTITATVNGSGFGAQGGKSYAIQVAYGNTAANSFTVIICDPPYNVTSTYKLVVNGDKDIIIPSSTGGLPLLNICLYEQKNNINVSKVANIYPSKYALMTDQFFYEVSAPSGYKAYPEDALEIDGFRPYTIDTKTNVITKMPVGMYTVTVYQKTSTGKKFIATTAVSLTDSEVAPKYEVIKTNTTTYSITASMTEAAARSVVLDCMRITWFNKNTNTYDQLGTNDIEIALVNNKLLCSSKNLYVGNLLCKRSVTVGGTTYTVPYNLPIGRTFTSTY